AAHIQPRPGAQLTEADVREALRGQLASYKIPTRISIVEALPRDDSGKVYKRLIQNLYAAEESVASGVGME
ncbi:acyl-CoA synthetase, partial [Nocardia tengchongensis]